MIEFYDKDTVEIIDNTSNMYFVRGDGSVWRDTGGTCESQSEVVGFKDFCVPCPDLGWRLAWNWPSKV